MKAVIIISFLLFSGCSFPDTSAPSSDHYRVKECMELLLKTIHEKTIFRCEPVSEYNTGVIDLGKEYNLPSPERYQDED